MPAQTGAQGVDQIAGRAWACGNRCSSGECIVEASEEARHRMEAERFRRLADLSADPALKSILARIAEAHRGIAERLTASDRGSAQPPGRGRR